MHLLNHLILLRHYSLKRLKIVISLFFFYLELEHLLISNKDIGRFQGFCQIYERH